MKDCKTLKKYRKQFIIMPILIGVTFITLLKDNNMKEILDVIKSVNLKYIFCGVICIFVYAGIEALNIRRTLNLLVTKRVSYPRALQYAYVGFFFNAITPSASGGQPMQIYYMKKDDIEVSHSSLALLMALTGFQFVSIGYSVTSVLVNMDTVVSMPRIMKVIICVGIALNLLLLLFVLIAIFSNNFIVKVVKLFFSITDKLKFVHLKDKTKENILKQVSEYKYGVTLIVKNPMLFVKIVVTTIIQLTAMYSITYFVYRALGLNKISYIHIIGLQSILSASVACFPLPGAVGVSESVFLLLFKVAYPPFLLSSAMILSRGINFYLVLIISAIIVMFTTIRITDK